MKLIHQIIRRNQNRSVKLMKSVGLRHAILRVRIEFQNRLFYQLNQLDPEIFKGSFGRIQALSVSTLDDRVCEMLFNYFCMNLYESRDLHRNDKILNFWVQEQ